MNKITIKMKLIVALLAAGLVPMMIIGLYSINSAKDALEMEAFNKLVAIRTIKKNQIEGFFNERLGDVKVLADNPFIVEAFKNLDEIFQKDGGVNGGFRGNGNFSYQGSDEYKKIHNK